MEFSIKLRNIIARVGKEKNYKRFFLFVEVVQFLQVDGARCRLEYRKHEQSPHLTPPACLPVTVTVYPSRSMLF